MANAGWDEKPKKDTCAASRSATTSPLPREEYVGSWLCEKGPYQEYIEALSKTNPSLKKPDPANDRNPLKPKNALVVLLEAAASGAPEFVKTDFDIPSKLQRHFDECRNETEARRRVYIMEGLAPDFIATLGGHFFMDPTLFQRQERSCVWSNKFTPTSDALPQPSLLDPEKTFNLQYCELRQFNKNMPNAPFFCERTGRHVGITSPRHEEETTIGILRRKISWWSRKTFDGGWDVLILCDPQLDKLRDREKIPGHETLSNTAFQDGYVDFVPTPDHLHASKIEVHPHKSMREDLCHYFKHHAYLIEDWESPLQSSIFLKKIVAAHYLQLVDYIKAMLPSLELRLTTAWVEEQDQWKSLQTISRRCGNFRDDMEDMLLSLGYPLDGLQSYERVNWQDCKKDYQYIYLRLKILKERADNLMQAMTGLASIAGNRQNLEEAKRVKRLNLLALLFIPLAYTSSLFSMQDSFAPNAEKFWVYWVSAIGLVGFTALITWVLDRALDDEANWTLPFKFWEKDMKNGGNQPKRRGTGFYKLAKAG